LRDVLLKCRHLCSPFHLTLFTLKVRKQPIIVKVNQRTIPAD